MLVDWHLSCNPGRHVTQNLITSLQLEKIVIRYGSLVYLRAVRIIWKAGWRQGGNLSATKFLRVKITFSLSEIDPRGKDKNIPVTVFCYL